MDDERYLEWKQKGEILNLIEIRLRENYENGKIKKRKRNKIKKMLNKCWIQLWDFYPDKNLSVEQAFKSCFS
jgi:hypothetical protein